MPTSPAPPAPALPRRSGLAGLGAALEGATRRLLERPGLLEAEDSVRRIAMAIAADTAVEGRPDVAVAAARVLRAGPGRVTAAGAALLALVRTVEPGIRGELILIVEDDEVAALGLARSLALPGRRVEIAGSAAAAREAIAREVPSLLVLDLILPDGDGRNLLLELRSSPRTAAVAVVVVTARLGDATRAECFALGADGYFEKPVEPRSFGIAISARLGRQAELTQLCRRDSITGLPNRAAFLEAWPELRRHAPPGTAFALAALDLDHFRYVGERWGRQFADEVLRQASLRLTMALGSAACFARWDGSEFLALFSGLDAVAAAAEVERALAALRRIDFRAGMADPLLLTFSAGVSDLGPGRTLDDALADADRLLHLAKSAGRNRVLAGDAGLGFPSRRILIAEDDPDVVRIVSRQLRAEGFEVLTFPNGRLALEAAPTSGAALVISDIEMPELDGLDFLAGLRRHPMLRHVPVMMLTAVGAESVIVRAFELGADDYVTKPFSVREVAARVRRLLRRPSVAGQPAPST